MRFGVLGPLTAWTADGTPAPVQEAKVRALLAALLTQGGRPVSADRLVLDLWGDEIPANPLGALQTKVSRLRRAIGRDLVESGPAGYRLRAEVDAAEFADLLAAAQDAPPRERAGLLVRALELWRGPAYAEFADEDFARPVAQHLEEQRLVAVELLGAARLELGEVAEALAGIDEPARRHPLRERLHAVRLRALYLAGRQAEALTEYAGLRTRLATELGADPGPELAGLHESMLRQDPGLRVAVRSRTNLPAALTELIGREHTVRAVRALLTRHRLVTLTGPGGVGKTSLALAAAEPGPEYPDGVWLIELAGHPGATACTAAEIAESVAGVLHVRDDSGAGLAAHLAEALRDQRLLLVLDNCEHALAPAADLIAHLLRAAPGLRVLATSREPLGVPGERLEAVPPLAPADAVRLLTQRAEAAGADLSAVTPEQLSALCLRLDSLPLALELAAPRLRVLGLTELLSRVDDRFRLLTTGGRLVPPRQRTLRAVIDWSWDLLTEPERIVLRRLAVHAEGATLAAAEAVSAAPPIPAEDVLDLVARLVDRSLVVVADGPRYRLLESIGDYARTRLGEAGELAEVRDRHLACYLELAENARLRDAGQREWLPRLDRESANLRRALDTAVETADADRALRLVRAQTWYWFLRGRLSEAERQLRLALSVPGAHPLRDTVTALLTGITLLRRGAADPDIRGQALEESTMDADTTWFLSFCLGYTGADLTASASRLAEVSTVDPWLRAITLATTSYLTIMRGDLRTAAEQAAESLAVFVDLGEVWGRSQATFALSTVAEITGDYPRSADLRGTALELAQEHGLWPDVADQLTGLARLDLLTGNHSRAQARHEQARRLSVEHGYHTGVIHAELGLAMGTRRTGDLDTAAELFHRVLSWHQDVSYAPGIALAHAELGFIAELRGHPEEALAAHTTSLTAAEISGDPRAVALAKEGLAGAHSLAGDYNQASTLLAEAAAHRAATGAPLPPAERGDVDRIEARIAASVQRQR
ncbi:BTAD domain-containing putative transcriptional regulator [Crossiella cryophila]|uniref:Putative ATPase n=1 Tax=Crossiella cryophila TaxID=43355 RepID=A0A7W7FVX8_9PSEU|nr:BTAD domain-containing putative transcriptional regulator [Crossiella cryophila]MBB4678998.1 putative ATPase [Crossiella cryophila]